MIVSTVPTRLPAAGTRRAIQRSCCRCTWPLVQSSLAVGWAFGTPLSAQDSDRYVTEMMVAAEFVGVPRPVVPASVADLERYVASVRPELRCTPAARESMAHLLDPPRLGRGGRRVLGKRRDKPAWRRRWKSSTPKGSDPTHGGPESCVDVPRGRGEALTGASAGRAIEPRIRLSGVPTLSKRWKATLPVALSASRRWAPRGRRTRACTEPSCARTGRARARPSG